MSFTQVNLVSDVPGTAKVTDENLTTPMGMVVTDLIWVCVGGTLVIGYDKTTYQPTTSFTTNFAPVAIVSTEGTNFPATDKLIIITNDGTEFSNVEVYRPTIDPSSSVVVNTIAGQLRGATIYNGLLYTAKFFDVFETNVTVFDTSYQLRPDLTITDSALSDIRYGPFNVYTYGDKLYITFAQSNLAGFVVPGGGRGYLSVYRDGVLTRLVSRGPLNAPWGIVRANNVLYVGNNGDGLINEFDLCNDARYCGPIETSCGGKIVNDGLWAVVRECNSLYITAAPNGGNNGLLARLDRNCR